MTKLVEVLGVHSCCLSTGKDCKNRQFSFQEHQSLNMIVKSLFAKIFKTCANVLALILNRHWVKLGALATVVSMAFDPVYQAFIGIEQRPIYQSHPAAFVKRALSFKDSINGEY